MMPKEVAEIQECPACASLNIVRNEQREQVVCKDCGVIFEPTPLLDSSAPAAKTPTHAGTAKKKKTVKKKKR